jgi:hypothetical protein
MRREPGLQRRVDRGEQVSELVDEARDRAPRAVGREFVEMRALYRELHEERADSEQTALLERAQIGRTGSESSAAMTLQRLLPKRSDRLPDNMPPHRIWPRCCRSLQ